MRSGLSLTTKALLIRDQAEALLDRKFTSYPHGPTIGRKAIRNVIVSAQQRADIAINYSSTAVWLGSERRLP